MGIFSGLMGNASQMDTDKVENQLSDILISDEQVDLAYTLIRDLIVFTNYRLILVDKQGVTEVKRFLIILYLMLLYHVLQWKLVVILI